MFALGDIHEKGILHRDLKPQKPDVPHRR